MIVDGLESPGEIEFARQLKLRYCGMAARSGFAENYNAGQEPACAMELHLVGKRF